MLRYAVTAMLLRRADHGYGLFRRFEESTAGVWQLNGGSVYHAIKQLTARKEIAGTDASEPTIAGGDESVRYVPTEPGEMSLHGWLRQPLRRPEAYRSEVALRLLAALQVDDECAVGQIDVAIELYSAHLDTLEAQVSENSTDAQAEVCRELMLDGALRETRSRLAWLEYCRVRLSPRLSHLESDQEEHNAS
jgi:DNA-binding PadR family transcriptional regulator